MHAPTAPRPLQPRATVSVSVVASLALLASIAVRLHHGFVGLSDDDAARTLLAASFSHAPSLDATRSSWLPIPTYLLGTATRFFAPPLSVAHGTSILAGVASCVLATLVCRAARASAGSSAAAVVGVALWRWSVMASAAPGLSEMLGVTFLLSATLAWLSPVAQNRSLTVRETVAAGVTLSLACGCRYEAWFAAPALGVAFVLAARDRTKAIIACALALVVPIGWLAVNHTRHGDAFEFVHRVQHFRRATGLPSLFTRVSVYPRIVVRDLLAVVALSSIGLVAWRTRVAWLLALPPLSILLALVLTEIHGSGATHHSARALLPFAWLLTPVTARGLDALWPGKLSRRAVAVSLALTMIFVMSPVETTVSPDAIATGRALASLLLASPRARALIALDREDFLWVEVATNAPDRCVPDRAYGHAAPSAAQLSRIAGTVTVAAVASAIGEATLRSAGWFVRSRHGDWRVMAR